MRRLITAGVVALALAGAGAAHAQLPFELELRGGAGFPTEDLGDWALKTGGGAGLTVNIRVLPPVALYGGWDWFQFQPKETASEFDVEHTGYAFGLQVQRTFSGSIGGWARAGGLYTHVEIEDGEGDLVSDSGHELGWEVGGGARIPIAYRLALTPGMRYRNVSVDLDDANVDLSYFTAEIGLQLVLGSRPGQAALRR